MIELKNIKKIYRQGSIEVPALRGVDLKIERGEFVAIMGHSGSGKSTLLQILGLLDKPTSGQHHFLSQDISHLKEDALAELRAEEIGFVFQQFHLLSRTSALDNVSLPLIYQRQAKRQLDPKTVLERVSLGTRIHHLPNELSGGQQQRVAIARALIRNPNLILADEPTGNLDSASGREIMTLFQELNRQGITIILVTHEPSIADYANRIIKVQDGLICSDETKNPITPEKVSEKITSATSAPPSPTHKMLQLLHTQLRQAGRALLANKLRTCLSTLGIVIGVGAVVAMLALGRGAQKSVKDQLSGLGSNRITIRPNVQYVGGVRLQIGSVSRLTLNEVRSIQQSIPEAKVVVPIVRSRAQVVFGNKNSNTEIVGTTPDYVEIYSVKPQYGRFFTLEQDTDRERVALLGSTVVRELFVDQNPIGQMIKINRISFRVIGILPTKGTTGPRDEDDLIIIPLQTAMRRLMGKLYLDSIDVAAADSSVVDQAQNSILELSRTWPKTPNSEGDSYRVDNLASVQEAFSAIARVLSIILAAIAGISLVVGGIGIMNIMLVSVTERTREIGLRKAIGARNFDILSQILIESVMLCFAGGLVGIGLGWVLILIAAKVTGWTLSISFASILLACGFSATIGIIFGLWPARVASLKHPIEALRYE
ncbi:MAG: ABC transporter permease [Verrucomicrobiia bacterium]